MVTRRVSEDEGAKRPRFTRCSSLTRWVTMPLPFRYPLLWCQSTWHWTNAPHS